MNDENLKALSPSEAREYGRRGGIASGESRRRKRLMRERLEAALELPHRDMFDGTESTKGEAVIASLIEKAISGDVSACRLIVQTIDGLPKASVEVEPPIPAEVYAEVERAVLGDDQ